MNLQNPKKLSFDLFHPKPLLIVISGPTAVGKDAVIKLLVHKEVPLHFVVTATSRPRRDTEVNGVDYIFVSLEEFKSMIQKNELVEYALVYDDYKGIPRSQIEPALASGKDVIMRVDVQGACKVRQLYPESVQIFMLPTNEEELLARIRRRGSESEDQIQRRLAIAHDELKQIDRFDYVVINEDEHLDDTVNTILAIIEAEHHRLNRSRACE